MSEEKSLVMSTEQLKSSASEVARELSAAGANPVLHALRARFIAVRTALFQRGLYDPVLVRFDSATAPIATSAEVGAQLEKVAASL